MPGGTFPVNVMIHTIKKSKSLENKYKRRGCQGASLLLLVIASPWSWELHTFPAFICYVKWGYILLYNVTDLHE